MSDVPSYDSRNGKRKEMPPGAPHLPTIKVTFNPETQAVGIGFEPSEFKSWDFVVATLDMAKSFAEFNRNLQRAQQAQMAAMQAAAEQQQAAQLASNIRRSLKH